MKIKALVSYFLLFISAAAGAETKVVRLFVDGTIHPIMAEYVSKAVDYASSNQAEVIVLEIQTPGGLSESMRTMISKIINSPVPIIVYVAPSGSRATSAGFYITIAADLAAMAPGTHLGSAHPVSIQQTPDSENTKVMMKKITEDSVAYIKTLAERRGRNVEQAEKAVRDSVSFTENEALKANLINYIASDIHDLLRKADGLNVKRFNGTTKKLNLKNPRIIPFEMTRRQEFLSLLADPNVALGLIGIGTLGIMIELYNPGAILPGIVGVICIALFSLSMQILPISSTGLLLILFAVILFILELKITSHGLLGIGGIVSFILGATMLIDAPIPEMKVAVSVIILIASLMGITMAFLLTLVIQLHRKKPLTGIQGLLQEIGTAQTDIDPEGQVFVHGEIWKAMSPHPIAKGDKVRILSVDGLMLHVEKYNDDGYGQQTAKGGLNG